MAQWGTVPVPKRWPLVNRLQTRSPNIPLTKDARIINGYAEFDPEDKEYWVYKRLGIAPTPIYSPPGGSGIAAQGVFPVVGGGSSLAYMSAGTAYVDGISYGAINNQAAYKLNYYPGSSTLYPKSMVFHNTYAGYILVYPGHVPGPLWTLSTITDTQFNTLITQGIVPGIVSLNGTTYIMSNQGAIQGSNVNDPTVWPATNQILANNEADFGVAIAKQLSYIVAFKQWSTQIFYDSGTGSPGSTLAPVQDAQVPFGLLYPYSVGSIDDILLWVTSNKTISPQIIMMENLRPQIVSTPSIERLLDNIADSTGNAGPTSNNGVWSWTIKHAGHRFYGLSSLTLGLTLVFDIDQKLWHVWQGYNGGPWLVTGAAYIGPGAGAGQHIAQISNGGIYAIDGAYEYPNDSGNMFPVDIYTPNYDGGTTRRKHLNALYFTTDIVAGSSLQCRYSDDDFNTWSNFRTISLDQPKPFLDREGSFDNRRAYHFRHMANTEFRIKSGDLQLDIGTI